VARQDGTTALVEPGQHRDFVADVEIGCCLAKRLAEYDTYRWCPLIALLWCSGAVGQGRLHPANLLHLIGLLTRSYHLGLSSRAAIGIWPYLALSGPIWPYLALSGPI